jgi:hypothetical protein
LAWALGLWRLWPDLADGFGIDWSGHGALALQWLKDWGEVVQGFEALVNLLWLLGAVAIGLMGLLLVRRAQSGGQDREPRERTRDQAAEREHLDHLLRGVRGHVRDRLGDLLIAKIQLDVGRAPAARPGPAPSPCPRTGPQSGSSRTPIGPS